MRPGDCVRIENAAGQGVQAKILAVFDRASTHRFQRDLDSTSGGTAMTVNRMAVALFDSQPIIQQVFYVLTRAPLVLFILQIGEACYCDIRGTPCKVMLVPR